MGSGGEERDEFRCGHDYLGCTDMEKKGGCNTKGVRDNSRTEWRSPSGVGDRKLSK